MERPGVQIRPFFNGGSNFRVWELTFRALPPFAKIYAAEQRYPQISDFGLKSLHRI